MCGLCSSPRGSFKCCSVEAQSQYIVELRSLSGRMGHKKRKQKAPEEPDNKKAAKLSSEDDGGNEEATTQKITVEVVPKKDEKQEVKKEDEDMKEPTKAEGNGSQSSGKKKKKKKKNANKGLNEPKKNETVDPNDGFVDDYVFTKEDAETLMETFSKDELADILKLALKKHGDLVSEVANVARKDSAKRKLFVRGLGWHTKPETLNSVFSAYGEVEKADIVMDRNSGKSKGFGFVTFKSFAGVVGALKEPSKKIDDRMTVCNLSTGVSAPAPDSQQVHGRKIYVGGLPKDVDSAKLVKLFSQYGEIEEGPLGFDKKTGKSKGFAFFIYKSEKSANNALDEPTKTFDGATLTCKLAPPKNKNGIPSVPSKNGTPSIPTPAQQLEGNMWAYSSPLGGFIPVGNLGSPLFQQAFSKQR